MEYIDYLKQRRSVYNLSNEEVIPDQEVEDIIAQVLDNTPSAFNSQTQRVVLLFGKKQIELWEIVKDELKKIVSKNDYPKTEAKINGFMKARGTVMFFDAKNETLALMEKFPLYKHNFELWYQQQNGMVQANVWVALASKHIGASLQHYNELIEKRIKTAFDLPIEWELIAQMPFGKIVETPGDKPKLSLSTRLIVKK